MNQTPNTRGQQNRQVPAANSDLPRCRARLVAIVALATVVCAMPAFGPAALAASSWATGAGGTNWDAVETPLRQSDDTSLADPTPAGEREDDPDRMATVTAMLEQQGAQSAETLARVASFEVPNPLPMPEPTIDIAAEQTATANAAASATAAVATEVAMSVQATVQASATSVADQRAAARATQVAAASAAQAAVATPAAASVAEVTDGTAGGDEPPDVTPPAVALRMLGLSLAAQRLPALLVAFIPIAVGLAGLMLWRGQREPFVLKAKPVRS